MPVHPPVASTLARHHHRSPGADELIAVVGIPTNERNKYELDKELDIYPLGACSTVPSTILATMASLPHLAATCGMLWSDLNHDHLVRHGKGDGRAAPGLDRTGPGERPEDLEG